MKRLLADAEAISGIHYEFGNYADMVQAIHVIQQNLGITGTTAKEAEETITGSLNAMKAAWKNLSVGLADDNADIEDLIDKFVESSGTAADNLIPRIEITLKGVGELIRTLLPKIMEKVPHIIHEFLPEVVRSGVEILKSLVDGIKENPDLIVETVYEVIVILIEALTELLPEIIEAGVNLLIAFVEGISSNPEELINAAFYLIVTIFEAIITNLPKLIVAGVMLVAKLLQGIWNKIVDIVNAGKEIVHKIAQGIEDAFWDVVHAGERVVDKIKEGISNAWEGLKSWFNGIWDGLFGNRNIDVEATGGQRYQMTPTGVAMLPSFATGLNYVPYDNFKAALHEGEMVLPKEEAGRYRDGTAGGINITVNIAGNATAETGDEIGRRIAKELRYRGVLNYG